MSTLMCPRPLHPFPHLVAPPAEGPSPRLRPISAAQRRLLGLLAQGARILFDIQAKRALVYSMRQGLKTVGELTVRALAELVRQGRVVMTGRDDRLVHYALAHS